MSAIARLSSTISRWGVLLSASALVLGAVLVCGDGPFIPGRAVAACADTVVIRAAKTYTIPGTSAVTFYEPCTLTVVPGRRFLIEALTPSGSAVSTARIAYGGVEYFGAGDVPTANTLVSRVVEAQGAGYLKVTLTGATGSNLVVRITQVPEPQYKVYGSGGLSGGTSYSSVKTYTKYFSFSEGTPPAPHSLVLTNGNRDTTGAYRTQNTEVWLNNIPILTSSEVNTGKAFVTRSVVLESENALQVTIPQGNANKKVWVDLFGTDVTSSSITLMTPTNPVVTSAPKIAAEVHVDEAESGTQFFVDGVGHALTGGVWSDSLALPQGPGLTQFIFSTLNGACLTAAETLSVIHVTSGPWLSIIQPPAEVTTTTDSSVALVGMWGSATNVLITVGGDSVASGTPTGSFSLTRPLAFGTNWLTVRARDASGNESVVTRSVTRVQANEQALPAPIVQGTPLTSIAQFREAYAYVFRNPGGVQFDADTTLFTMQRAALLRGKVLTASGVPVPNVRVDVLGAQGFGWTKSRADGAWDLMVAGGGRVTLTFTKAGYLSVQRSADVPFRDVHVCDDVVMTGYDPTVTPIAFSQPIEAARGPALSDSSGTRRATMLFEQGTTASMILPDGSTQPLSSVSVRATELSVGERGVQAMPGQLPVTSAYTYCVDLSVDEAVNAGASSVVFSKPVAFYVENFLKIPVGTPVPVGYYDRARGAWVPSVDGRVIRVVGRDSSRALVDVDGDGAPDSPSTLLAMGIDEAERATLATTYADSAELWRVEMTHFSSWDLNYAIALVAGAVEPLLDFAKKLLESLNCQTQQSGSVIECESRVLGERIPIVGTPFDLVYRTSRAPGFTASRQVSIPIVGETLPAVLGKVEVDIEVAGKTYRTTYQHSQLTTFQRHDFTWDGFDAQGRPVRGSRQANIDVKWFYPTVMASAGGGANVRGFGQPRRGPGFALGTRGAEAFFRVRQQVALGTFENTQAGVGGWSIDAHHAYDMLGSGTLYRGDGERISGDRLRPTLSVLRDVAGLMDVAVGPDGSVYYASSSQREIRRIRPTGQDISVFKDNSGALSGEFYVAVADTDSIVVTCPSKHRVYSLRGGALVVLAGTGSYGLPSEEGMLAASANLRSPHGIALGVDGCVYFSDADAHAIYRVAPDGRIYLYAGSASGAAGFAGDGGLASGALLNNPKHMVFGPDGSLYVADCSNFRVRRIRADGAISTFAGNGGGGSSGDGGQARDAAIADCSSLAFGPDGSLYVAARVGTRLRRVAPDGFISTVAGTGVYGDEGIHTGGPAAAARLGWPTRIAVDQEGQLYVADPVLGGRQFLLLIRQVMPGFTPGETFVPSRDGGELFVFDANGRHLKTLDGLTGAWRHRFGYNDAGQLVSIADPAGLTTTIERNSSGAPTAIVGPFGHRTTIETDANGFLKRVTDPRGAVTTMTPDGGGMLSSFEDPNHHASTFTYDSNGLLQVDADAAGGSRTLAGGVVHDSVVHVTSTTAEQRQTTLDVLERRVGDLVRTATDPAGFHALMTQTPDGITLVNTPDGTFRRARTTADPRFGMTAPFLDSLTVQTGGKTLRIDGQRSYGAPTSPAFAYTRRTDKISVNGQISESAFDRVERRLTEQSPEGRQTITVMDSVGRPLRVRVPGLDSLVMAYDAQGRLSTLVQGPRLWTYVYDDSGRMATVTDPLMRETRLRYDAGDRVIRQELPGALSVGLGYDEAGNLTALRTPGDQMHHFTHTPVDLVGSYEPPTGGATGYAYDLDGELTTVTRPGGEVIVFDHDAAGRVETVSHAHDRIVNGYNAVTGLLVSAAADSGADVSYGYAGALPTGETWSFEPGVQVPVTLEYDDNFRVVRQNVGSDTLGYSYDRDGLLVRSGAERLVRDTSNALLRRVEVGVLVSEFAFNGAGEMIHSETRTTGGQVLYREGLTRDLVGRVSERRDSTWTGSTFAVRTDVYGYDDAGRLESVDRNGARYATYTYDANGNRLTFAGPTVSDTATAQYDERDRLLRYGDVSYAYTQAGELAWSALAGDTTRFDYDALGALRRIVRPDSAAIEYEHDAAGRRVGRVSGGAPWRRWAYQNALAIVAELNSAGSLVTRYVYGSRGHVPDLMVRSGSIYRLVTDHLGSVVAVVDAATGAVVGRRTYSAWGEVEEDTNPGLTAFGFAGGLTDEATGLIRFGVRDYDARLGRWTGRDPIGFAGGSTNLQAYVDADPVNFIDPSGTRGDQESIDNIAGFFDCLSFGWTKGIRDRYFSYNDIDPNSVAYREGGVSAGGVKLAVILGGLGKLAARLRPIRPQATASELVGRRGSPIRIQPGRNTPGRVGGRDYTGHAFDSMQGRGLTPSVVENTIQTGRATAGNVPGTTKYFDAMNGTTVIVDSGSGRVITAY